MAGQSTQDGPDARHRHRQLERHGGFPRLTSRIGRLIRTVLQFVLTSNGDIYSAQTS